MLFKENNYDFRKRMLQIHERNIVNSDLLPDENEFVIEDGVTIYVSELAGDIVLTAAKDFVDFLFTSMRVSARIKCGRPDYRENHILLAIAEDENINLEEANGYRGYRIDTDTSIKIYGFDERGIAQALYALEDIMSIRHAPFIPKGKIEKKPAFSPQMVHSGYGLDEYPNEHLSAIAHEGRDAILVFVKDVDITPCGYLDFNELIYRAQKYGLDVYAYSYLKSEKHPDDEDAESYYESNYGKLFKKCPGLKGITLVGESVEFPSKDEHVTVKKASGGIPTGKPGPAAYPCIDYPRWLDLIKRTVRKYKSDADIVFWTYNWGYQPEEARIKLIEALPTDITLQATFEMFEPIKYENSVGRCADYTLSFEGYGAYFKSEAVAAKKKGIKLYSMTNTGGLTWDFGVIGYEPFPYQWIKRYKAMRKAHEEWGLEGIMESHHYGFYPSFISKLSKMAFLKPWDNPEKLLQQIICGYFGVKAADKVDEALKIWSEAITYYTPSDADQYGAFRIGPAYPFCLDILLRPASAPYSMFGNSICFPEYRQLNEGRESLVSIRVHDEIKSLEKMKTLIKDGLDILEKIEDKNDNLLYLINLGWFILRTVITGINAKKWNHLRCGLRYESDREKLTEIIDTMETLLLSERENAEKTISLVKNDSRLGWEPSMEYMADEEHIKWKLQQIDYVRNTELRNVGKSLEM